jgi:mycofactocin precursor
VPRTGAIQYPSGWVGNYPFGEYTSAAACHSVGAHITTTQEASAMDHNESDTEDLVAETLVEEVSIDGMCGVY